VCCVFSVFEPGASLCCVFSVFEPGASLCCVFSVFSEFIPDSEFDPLPVFVVVPAWLPVDDPEFDSLVVLFPVFVSELEPFPEPLVEPDEFVPAVPFVDPDEFVPPDVLVVPDPGCWDWDELLSVCPQEIAISGIAAKATSEPKLTNNFFENIDFFTFPRFIIWFIKKIV
nr:hypothetical protein - Mycoplasma hyorhinis [Mesomycoplasma hyorhinis]